MTRINSAISVCCLTDEHLLAEHREIKRMPYYLRKAIKSGSIKNIPEKFTLGTGHVLFFLDKGRFTVKRYCAILRECRKRGFDVQDYSSEWIYYTLDRMNDYEPTDEERKLLIERISKRINESKKQFWHYYGKTITKNQAVILLTNM